MTSTLNIISKLLVSKPTPFKPPIRSRGVRGIVVRTIKYVLLAKVVREFHPFYLSHPYLLHSENIEFHVLSLSFYLIVSFPSGLANKKNIYHQR